MINELAYYINMGYPTRADQYDLDSREAIAGALLAHQNSAVTSRSSRLQLRNSLEMQMA